MTRRKAGKKRPNQRRRKKSHWSKKRHPMHETTGRKTAASNVTDLSDKIIAFLFRQGGEADVKSVQQALGATRGDRKIVDFTLAELCQQRMLHRSKNKVFRLNAHDFVEGVLSVHPRGFAFVALDAEEKEKKSEKKDLFIPARALASGLHGDRVLVHIGGSRRGRSEGRVVTVLDRVTTHLVGIYSAVSSVTGKVLPEDDRYPFAITTTGEDETTQVEDGDAVLVEITEFAEDGTQAQGRIIEVLGNPDSSRVQMEMVIRKYELPHVFDDACLKQAAQCSSAVTMTDDRRDLRDIFHVTIDGETARDFDDAVSVQKTRKGYRLYVSIADVSHYVQPGSPLDQEAWRRGTSVYFPTGVLPMLPERLSNGLCSLNPHVDRYAFTAILDFDRSGKRLKSTFVPSVICSAYRLTYTLVRQIIVDKDPAVRRENKPLLTPLKWMAELGTELEKRRIARGSMGFEIPETYIEIGEDDRVCTISKRHRNQAHKIIEEFMLAANEAVAETFATRKFPAMYRIHQSPDFAKVAEFCQFMKTLGYEMPGKDISSKDFNRLLAQIKDTEKEYLVNNLILRVMQQARYSPENIGHFGLAAHFYTHFTSPIRRYPDLMVHRALKQVIGLGGPRTPSAASLVEDGEFVSKRERIAVDADREMADRMKVRFMEDKIGEVFAGIISGITSFGLFVQLTDTMISGAVALTDLPEDNYEFHEKVHTVMGRRTGMSYQVGDLVNVKLVSVDKRRQRINFEIAGAGEREDAAK